MKNNIKAFGYDIKDEECEKIIELSQVTLSCKRQDLDKIIDFLTQIKKDIKNYRPEYSDHWHYRDYNKAWTEDEPDLIIYISETEDESNNKEGKTNEKY